MESSGSIINQKEHWGTALANDFFELWTRKHISGGVYRPFLRSVYTYATENFEESYRLEEIKRASHSEFPLAILKSYPIVDLDHVEQGASLFLAKVDTQTGNIIKNSEYCWFANLLDDGTIDDSNDWFSESQIKLLLEQYDDQNTFGLDLKD